MHPDALAELTVDGRRRWIYLEVDRGMAELSRYAGFYLSGSWRHHYDRFPEVRIVTAHRPRVLRMAAEVEDAVRSFGSGDVCALESGLDVTVAWESAFLARPSAVA